MREYRLLLASAALALAAPSFAAAATTNYVAYLNPLSGSGVSGRADLSFDSFDHTLDVRVRATGLAPNQIHIQHIHGTFGDGTPAATPAHDHDSPAAPANPGSGMTPSDAEIPSFANGGDADGDGIIELLEGVPFYGPIVLNLGDQTKTGLDAFPTAPDGTIDFTQTYDLDDTASFGTGFGFSDLFPLTFRHIVVHGAFLAEGVGAGTPGEADGTAGYKLVLPVAIGDIQLAPVPLPAAGWMMLAGLGGLAGLRRLRRAA